MKKWLDDLYAILLKRGFKTLDNSLKNYDKINEYVNNHDDVELANEITIVPNGTYEISVTNSIFSYNEYYLLYSKVVGTGSHYIFCFFGVTNVYNNNFFNVHSNSNGLSITINSDLDKIIITNTTSSNRSINIYAKKIS